MESGRWPSIAILACTTGSGAGEILVGIVRVGAEAHFDVPHKLGGGGGRVACG